MVETDKKFIGRGESRVKQILERLYPGKTIEPQVHIKNVILREDFEPLDEVYQKHKFDFIILDEQKIILAAIEVNYKHGNTASRKWTNIFKPLLNKAGVIPVPINDYECKSLFNTKDERPLKWEDFEDVITALKMGGLKP